MVYLIEIDELWIRLTDENKTILIKQLLRKHPEDVKDLYKLADNVRNVLHISKYYRVSLTQILIFRVLDLHLLPIS